MYKYFRISVLVSLFIHNCRMHPAILYYKEYSIAIHPNNKHKEGVSFIVSYCQDGLHRSPIRTSLHPMDLTPTLPELPSPPPPSQDSRKTRSNPLEKAPYWLRDLEGAWRHFRDAQSRRSFILETCGALWRQVWHCGPIGSHSPAMVIESFQANTEL